MKKLLITLIILVSSFTIFAAVGPVYDSTDPSYTDKKAETVVSLDFSNAEDAEKSIIFGFSSQELKNGDFTPVTTTLSNVSLALQDANGNGEVYAINEENSPVYVFYQIINGSDVNVKISLSGALNYEKSTDNGIGWTVKWGENSSVSSEDSTAEDIITHSGSYVKSAGSYKLSITTDNLAKTTLQSKEYKANIVLEINDGN